MTPHVSADGSVLLKIKATNNAPNPQLTGANGQPSISKREAETEVLVKDGDTTVIGGIYTRQTSTATASRPVAGQDPGPRLLLPEHDRPGRPHRAAHLHHAPHPEPLGGDGRRGGSNQETAMTIAHSPPLLAALAALVAGCAQNDALGRGLRRSAPRRRRRPTGDASPATCDAPDRSDDLSSTCDRRDRAVGSAVAAQQPAAEQRRTRTPARINTNDAHSSQSFEITLHGVAASPSRATR